MKHNFKIYFLEIIFIRMNNFPYKNLKKLKRKISFSFLLWPFLLTSAIFSLESDLLL